MSLKYYLLVVPFWGISSAFSQELHKHFEAAPVHKSEKINLAITTKAGISYINSTSAKEPVVIYGGSENDIASSSFKMKTTEQTHEITAKLACKDHAGDNFTEAIASNLFNSDDNKKDLWQVNLSDAIPFDLDLLYMVGSSTIDLSNLSIERLKIKSGSADVFVKYSNKKANTVAMDTFFIKVNMGNIEVEDLGLSLAKDIIAEVGFGSIVLDCGNKWNINSRVNASVGAGSMTIKLPSAEQAVLVKLNNSALCHVKMGKDFQKVGHNAYANAAYRNNNTNYLEFSLDVGMGKIAFVNE